MVDRVEDLKQVGDYLTYEIQDDSILVVRTAPDKIRAYHNVCQHRGNRLCQVETGVLSRFSCPFHGWQWHTDGSLAHVAAPEAERERMNWFVHVAPV